MKVYGIVGFGYSGVATFCRLVDELIKVPNRQYKITVFEKEKKQFATGVPYTTDSPSIWTLNNPAEKFKLLDGGVTLAGWLSANRSVWERLYPEINEEYPPRALVGMYLKDQFQHYKDKAIAFGIVIEEVLEEIIDIKKNNETWCLSSFRGKPFSMDIVFLCLGHAPNNQFSHLAELPNYFSVESSLTALHHIPKDAKVHIIGGQASFVDIVIWLAYVNQHVGQIYSVTRNPAMMSTKGNRDECDNSSINGLVNYLKTQCKQNSLSLAEGQTLFKRAYLQVAKNPVDIVRLPGPRDALRYQMNKYTNNTKSLDGIGNIDELRSFVIKFYFSDCYRLFWNKLKDEDKKAFYTQFYSFICAYLTGITPLNAQLLLELYDRQLVVERSGLTSIQHNEATNRFEVTYANDEVEQAEYLIDASGYGYMLDNLNTDNLLLCNIVKRGYLVPARFGGIELSEFGQAINHRNELQPNLICIGPVASYCHPIPTPFSTFIAIDAIEKAVRELFVEKLQSESRLALMK